MNPRATAPHRAFLTLAALVSAAALATACSTAPDTKPAPKPAPTAAQPLRSDGLTCNPCRAVLCVDRNNRVERIDLNLDVGAPNPRIRFSEATLQLTGKNGKTQIVPLDTRTWRADQPSRMKLKQPKLTSAGGGWNPEGAVTVSWEEKGKSQGAKLPIEVEAKRCP